MIQVQQNQQERQAIQSLLELENIVQINEDWKSNRITQNKIKKPIYPFNFIQPLRKISPEQKLNQNATQKQKLFSIYRFKRARSLFDPMKIFKLGSSQLIYNQPLTPQPSIRSIHKKLIHKNPQNIKDLNFKTGHPSKKHVIKKDQICLEDLKNRSIEYLNGQSVMIQVQSYQQTFNKKEVEYLMCKTLGSKDFKSKLIAQRKTDPQSISLLQIKSQDMKLQNSNNQKLTKCNKNQSRLSSRKRFANYSRRSQQKQKNGKINQGHSSLDLKIMNQQITVSLRQLLNNLKYKNYSHLSNSSQKQFNHTKFQPNLTQNAKIFDKDMIFKSYQEQEFKGLKKSNRQKKQNFQNKQRYFYATNSNGMRQDEQDWKQQRSRGYQEEASSPSIMKKQVNQSKRIVINQSKKISSPHKYYQKSNRRSVQQNNQKIFNIKKLV